MTDRQWPLVYNETTAEITAALQRADKMYLGQVVAFWSHAYEPLDLPPAPVFLALVLYSEARGEDVEGQRAVFEVIANRATRRADGDLDSILLAPWQFSCFNKGDYSLQRAMIVDGGTLRAWLKRALEYVMEWNADEWSCKVFDATMYSTPKAATAQFQRWLGNDAKAWNFDRLTRVATIGRHVFFRET